jgi:hypothetical protein
MLRVPFLGDSAVAPSATQRPNDITDGKFITPRLECCGGPQGRILRQISARSYGEMVPWDGPFLSGVVDITYAMWAVGEDMVHNNLIFCNSQEINLLIIVWSMNYATF